MIEETYEQRVEDLKSDITRISESLKIKNHTIDEILKLEKKIKETRNVHDELMNDLEVEHFLEYGPGRIDVDYEK